MKDGAIEITVAKTIEVSREDVNDIMVTALEGGINYWCGGAKIIEGSVPEKHRSQVKYASDAIGYGGSLCLYDAESDDVWELTPEKFANGLQEFVNMWSLTEVDPGELDAGDADSIVQLAVFNEIIFG